MAGWCRRRRDRGGGIEGRGGSRVPSGRRGRPVGHPWPRRERRGVRGPLGADPRLRCVRPGAGRRSALSAGGRSRWHSLPPNPQQPACHPGPGVPRDSGSRRSAQKPPAGGSCAVRSRDPCAAESESHATARRVPISSSGPHPRHGCRRRRARSRGDAWTHSPPSSAGHPPAANRVPFSTAAIRDAVAGSPWTGSTRPSRCASAPTTDASSSIAFAVRTSRIGSAADPVAGCRPS